MGDAINIAGLISMIIFYLIILAIGLLAAWFKTKKNTKSASASTTVMVADRDIGLFIGMFTMTATWVGGGYINGTAEIIFTSGIVWAQAPIGYSLSFLFAGIFLAGPMRSKNYFTMLDPFQIKYGERIGGLMYFPALCGEIFWTAAILNALGSTIAVILNLQFNVSIIVSACVAIVYTFFGGLYSVVYTDVVQLMCIVLGLIPCIPYALRNQFVDVDLNRNTSIQYTINNQTIVAADFWGTVPREKYARYIDDYLLIILGGIPWQVYFQRVLSTKSVWSAKVLSISAAFGSLGCAAIAAAVGFIARFVDWNAAGYPSAYTYPQTVLPGLVQYATPPVVSFLGLGAVSAAVMSSSDSSMLSASSMFAYNIYKMVFRQKASETEVVWVLRCGIVVCGVVACCLGIFAESVYVLWYLCSDLVYVLLFPQLVLVVYVHMVNSYGVLSGFTISFIFRILLGEMSVGLPPAAYFHPDVPWKTVAMLINLFITLLVSYITNLLYVKYKKVPMKYDCLNAFNTDHRVIKERTINL